MRLGCGDGRLSEQALPAWVRAGIQDWEQNKAHWPWRENSTERKEKVMEGLKISLATDSSTTSRPPGTTEADRTQRIIEGLLETPGAQNNQGRKDKWGSSLNVWLTTGRPWKPEEKGAIDVKGARGQAREGQGLGRRGRLSLPAVQPWALQQIATNLSLKFSSRKWRSSLSPACLSRGYKNSGEKDWESASEDMLLASCLVKVPFPSQAPP